MNDKWAGARWIKAESSGDHGCVEVAFLGGRIGVRDTKSRGTGPVLAFGSHEWECFLAGARRGEFDLPHA
jgi:hypothetical protein